MNEAGERRTERWFLAAIVGIALVVRVVHLAEMKSSPGFELLVGDGRAYAAWADRILAGRGGDVGVFYQAPLYPHWLVLMKALFGDDTIAWRICQAGIGAGACALLFLAARSFFDRRVAAVAALLLALYPPAIFHDAIVQKTSLVTFLSALLLLALANARDNARPRAWLTVGGALAMLALVREETLVFLPVLAGWAALRWRGSEGVKRAGCAALGTALALAPVAVRNAVVGGELVVTTAQAGPNLYIGNHAGASGLYEPLVPGRGDAEHEREDARRLAERAEGRTLSDRDVSRHWRGRAIGYAREHPSKWLGLLARKASYLVHSYEWTDTEGQYYHESHGVLLRLLGRLLHLGVVGPIALAGFLLCRGRRDTAPLPILAAAQGAVVVLFFVSARYRFPLVPIVLVFAAVGLVHAVRGWRAGERRRVAVAGLAALALAAVANRPLFDRDDQIATGHLNAGVALTDAGRFAEAELELAAAIELRPRLALAHDALGVVRMRAGRTGDAVAAFEVAADLEPDDARIQKRLGTALAEAGDLDGAAENLARSFELAPYDPETASNLSAVLGAQGRWGELVRQLGARLEARPDDELAAAQLAWILATNRDAGVRDGAEALRLSGELVARSGPPGDPDVLDVHAAALAESARFDEAVRTAELAAELAAARGDPTLAAAIEERRAAYAARRPWRE